MKNEQEYVVWLNGGLYVSLFLLYQLKIRYFRLGSFALLIYAVSAIFGIVFFYSPLSDFRKLQIFPVFFLFSLFLLVVYPLLKFDTKTINRFTYNTKVIDSLSLVLGILSIIPSIEITLLLSTVSNMDNTVFSEIHRMKNAGEGNIRELQLSSISRPLFLIISRFSDITPILLFIQLTSNKRNWSLIILVFISIYCVNGMGVINGGRSELTNIAIYLFALYLIFKDFFTSRSIKIINKYGLVIISLIASVFIFITLVRFNTKTIASELSVLDWISLYAGEGQLYFNEYVWNMHGTTEGDYIFSYFKQFLDLNTFTDVVERREYWVTKTNIPQHVFYTFMGTVVEDFGKFIGPIFLLIVTAIIQNFIRIKKRIINFAQIIILGIWCRIVILGVTFYPYGGHNKTQLLVVDIIILLICLTSKNNAIIERKSKNDSN